MLLGVAGKGGPPDDLAALVDCRGAARVTAERAEIDHAARLRPREGVQLGVAGHVAVATTELAEGDGQAGAGSKRSLSRFRSAGTLVGYSRVKQARHTAFSSSPVAHCIPSTER